MKKMKNLMLLLSLFFLCGLQAQESKQFTLELSTPGKVGTLKVQNQNGPILIKGTNRKDILIKYKSLEDENIKMEKQEDGLTKISGGTPGFDIIEQDNVVTIESGFMSRKGIDFYIEVPTAFNLNVQAFMQGDVKVENIKGEVVIENFNGGIEALNISGHVIANSFNGPIKASFAQVSADTPMAFTNHNGDVDITFPANLKATFKVKTDMGDLYTGFEMDVMQEEMKKENKEGKWQRTFLGGWINATVNGGGPEIKVKTHNGDVYVRRN